MESLKSDKVKESINDGIAYDSILLMMEYGIVLTIVSINSVDMLLKYE